MGVVPLVFATGAGFEIRRAMGVAVFAGMLGVTAFGLFLTPVFYTVVGRLAGRARRGGARRIGAPRFLPRRRVTDMRWMTSRGPARRTVRTLALILLAGCSRLQPARGRTRRRRRHRPRFARPIPRSFRAEPYDPAWWQRVRRSGPRHARCARRSTRNLDVARGGRPARSGAGGLRRHHARSLSARSPSAPASIAANRPSPGFTDEPLDTTTYRAGFDAFWEIDLFGRVRSAVRAAAANARELRRGARRRPGERRGGGGAQLLRAARPAAAGRRSPSAASSTPGRRCA